MYSSEVKELIKSLKRNIRSITLDQVEYYDHSDHIFSIHLRTAMDPYVLKFELYSFYEMVWIQVIDENDTILFEHNPFRSPPLYLFISCALPDEADNDLNEDEPRDYISKATDELFSRR